jgi:glycosyltransferase involved in cell wall biosynthesis
VKDEEKTLDTLTRAVIEAVATSSEDSLNEIIFVDDGSADNSWSVMQRLTVEYPGIVRALRLRRNFGKAIALEAAFRVAKGDIIITMDADLQDEPKEIPRFLTALHEGYDMVSGWKRRRLDPVSKTLPSRLFNRATAAVSGIPLHDFNCGFKAYKREVIDRLRIYGELHRYIPVLAHDAGYKVGEIEVEHHPRRHGVTKYGIERYVRGFLDLLTVLVTTRYLQRPGHMFGGMGIVFGLIGFLILAYLTGVWVFGFGPIGTRPLFFLGILLLVIAVQMVATGALAELMIRISNPRTTSDLIIADLQETPGAVKEYA